MAEVPGLCKGDTRTVVWAHSNMLAHDKGRSMKAHDCFGCFACQPCHDYIDGRNTRPPPGTPEPRIVFYRAFERTLVYLWAEGLIGVK